MSDIEVPAPCEEHFLPASTLYVFPPGTAPLGIEAFAEQARALGMDAEAWHPFWGNATRVQHVAEILSGVAISGRPFVVLGR